MILSLILICAHPSLILCVEWPGWRNHDGSRELCCHLSLAQVGICKKNYRSLVESTSPHEIAPLLEKDGDDFS